MKISDNWISANNLTFEKLKSQLNLTARAYVWADIHTRRRFPEFVCNSDLISLQAELGQSSHFGNRCWQCRTMRFSICVAQFFFVPFLKWQSLLIRLSITASVTVSTILDAELSKERNIRFNMNRPKLVYHKQTAPTEETIKSDMNTNGISISVGDVRNGNFAFVFTMFCFFLFLGASTLHNSQPSNPFLSLFLRHSNTFLATTNERWKKIVENKWKRRSRKKNQINRMNISMEERRSVVKNSMKWRYRKKFVSFS